MLENVQKLKFKLALNSLDGELSNNKNISYLFLTLLELRIS